MAILTTMAGVPLFSTIQEALAWARANGLTGYHTHRFQNQIGYMGGIDHDTIVQRAASQPTTTRRRNYGGGGGSGSSGGGY
tara:strand:+ start:10 stop:252 length:243 start_codon:yes stop_codon:yes gene_type:complete